MAERESTRERLLELRFETLFGREKAGESSEETDPVPQEVHSEFMEVKEGCWGRSVERNAE